MIAWLVALALAQDSVFRHEQHARLFATCSTCHAGIATGGSDVMPAPAQCATCHDGRTEQRVSWRPRALEPANLRFSHQRHAADVRGRGDEPLACVACHASQGATFFMAAGRASAERCVSCHAHRATGHLAATSRCVSCHVPLRDARGLSVARIAAFPEPPSHDSAFVFTHGREARSPTCQVCHTRESCASCHADAARVPQIAALGSDARMAAIASLRAPVYPVPASHRAAAFPRTHGLQAAAPGATCAACHTRESCLACHAADARIGAIAALPARSREAGPGVQLVARRPPDHGPTFREEHRAAATAAANCSSCHTERFCASCHAETGGAGYHVANFVVRHSSDAYRTDMECSSCHQVTAFCSSCHRQAGVAARGGLNPGAFHTGVANWTFAHGGVARRSIETCASCHTQSFCAQCHSARRGWGVSPHGSSPPAGSRSAPACRFCHGA